MDVQAFDEESLFRKYYKSLCYFAWELIQDTKQAEDLVQDAFLGYWSNRDKIAKDEPSIKSYLYSSIRHAIYNLSRREKVIQKYFFRNKPNELDEIDYEHKVITAEFFAALHKIVADLPKSCGRIFQMSYFDEKTNKEIAQNLEISINTVKTQKQRALNYIRERLSAEHLFIFVLLFIQ